VIRWLGRLFRNRPIEHRLDAELEFHVEQQTADYIAAGMTPTEARRRTVIGLGGLEQTKQACRDVHWENRFESLYRDFRFALRSLKKDRRFTLVAILTLALGIGSTTLIFSVIDCVVLHPFPYKNPDRLANFTGVGLLLGLLGKVAVGDSFLIGVPLVAISWVSKPRFSTR
jgi:hypothetical protein